MNLEALRRYAISRTLFAPTTLPKAIARLGFVQADPIRAPARAQDLILRHRVKNYVAGDLERRYCKLGIEEDFFVNYGFLPRNTQALMHPRTPRVAWPSKFLFMLTLLPRHAARADQPMRRRYRRLSCRLK